MKKIVYTVILGDYKLNEPVYKNKDWKYLCFTDQNLKSKNWNIVNIEGGRKKSRELKIVNHNFFEYDLCLYLDSRFTVKQDLDAFVKNNLKHDIAVMKKKKRTCVYDEAEFCIKIGKDKRGVIENQINEYKKDGFPKDFGLVAPGIMIKKNTDDTIKFMDMWFDQVKKHSYRDILSFSYVWWKYPLNVSLMPFRKTYSSFMNYRG